MMPVHAALKRTGGSDHQVRFDVPVLWRFLRLPKGETDPAGLNVALTERLGEPRATPEVDQPSMEKGLASSGSTNRVSDASQCISIFRQVSGATKTETPARYLRSCPDRNFPS